MEIMLEITCTDKFLNKYPPIFIDELEKAIVLIWDSPEALEEMRKRLINLKAKVESRQGVLKYGHLKRYEPTLELEKNFP